ncbi:MAG: ORF6N domain-containing protein [bacterium]
MQVDSKGYLIPVERIDNAIIELRGERVMLDADLAALYGVSTKALNQAVKRNADRFPADFVFRLTADEKTEVVTSCDHLSRLKFSRTLPYAFTEHGAVMLASVLNSKRASEISVFVVRAFVRMRRMLADQRRFALKLAELESKMAVHDKNLKVVFAALRKLMQAPEPGRRPIGFRPNEGPERTGPADDTIARDRPRKRRKTPGRSA